MSVKIKKTLKKLTTPWKIQEYVSKIPYNPDDYARSAERVLLENKAHCFEGALLAALALENLGYAPQLLHFRAHRDDDHVVALFQEKGLWGAIGKSNTTLLAWRSPLYRDVRELAMSYFPFYFNSRGNMSLLSFAGPVKLKDYEKKWNWRNGTEDVGDMSATFYKEKSQKIMSIGEVSKHPRTTKLLMDACFLGANKRGLYKA